MSKLTAKLCELRAIEERHAADEASCDEAKIAHRELERRYAAEARRLRSEDKEANAGRHRRPLLSLRS
jgi:hypothetical protein